MEIYIRIIFFILGLCVGSFLNMAIFRVAKNYKLISKKQKTISKQITNNKLQITNKNRSYCDYCRRQLSWYENVPVLSWIVQKGQTRCCYNPLPWEYPIVEIIMGILFLLNFQFSIFNFQSILNYLIISLLMFSLVFDLKYMILPDRTNLMLVAGALVLWYARNYGDWSYIYSGLGSLLFFFILNRIKIRGSEAMGMGDVKYALFMGLFLGWPDIVVAIYFAFVVGAVVSIILLIIKKVKKENPIPFGPFLILGTVVAKIWGESIIKLIYNFQ